MDTEQYYLVDVATGSLRFTAKGRRELGRLFRFAGIKLGGIRTQDDYRQAVLRVRRAIEGMTSRQFMESDCHRLSRAAFDQDRTDREV